MASWRTRLSALQVDFLEEWFQREQAFFLTGGAVLVGFLGEPRTTRDLDLFTDDELSFRAAENVLALVCQAIQARWTVLHASPDFRRVELLRGDESTVLDFVRDIVPQQLETKLLVDGIRVDPAEELLINKLCTLVSRGEPRDFLDVAFLASRGHSIDQAIPLAGRKDGGVTEESLLQALTSVPLQELRLKGADPEFQASARIFLAEWAERLALRLRP